MHLLSIEKWRSRASDTKHIILSDKRFTEKQRIRNEGFLNFIAHTISEMKLVVGWLVGSVNAENNDEMQIVAAATAGRHLNQ